MGRILTKSINYKKVKLTEEEFSEYEKICRSYDRPNFKGEDLFKDMFEVNDDGMIIYIKSLGNRQVSFEVLFFIMNLMQNQWLRAMAEQINQSNNKLNSKILELEKRLSAIESNK